MAMNSRDGDAPSVSNAILVLTRNCMVLACLALRYVFIHVMTITMVSASMTSTRETMITTRAEKHSS